LRLGAVWVTKNAGGIEDDQGLLEFSLFGGLELFEFGRIAVVAAEQAGPSCKQDFGDLPGHGIGDAEHVVRERLPRVSGDLLHGVDTVR
jgi:hypothetical protein